MKKIKEHIYETVKFSRFIPYCCDEKMEVDERYLLTSNPPKYTAKCTVCGETEYIDAEQYRGQTTLELKEIKDVVGSKAKLQSKQLRI